MEHNYCRRCGNKLEAIQGLYRCKEGHNTFVNASPTAGVVFMRNGKVVLSRRGEEPNKGSLDTVGGFVDLGENFEEAIIREIAEETKLTEKDFGPLKYLCSAVSPYHYQNEDRQVLSVFFTSELNVEAKPIAQDDVASIEELSLEDVNLEDVGGEDVKVALKILKELS